MNALHSFRLLALAGVGSVLSTSALAQDAGYGYGGISVGASRANIDQPRITAGLAGAGLATSSFARDERDGAYKLFGGYQFNRNLALEGGYFSLGKFGFTSTTVPAGTLTGQLKAQGLNLDLVATLPLGERFSVFGRVGAQVARVRDTFDSTGAVSVLDRNPSKRGANVKFGGGLQYEVSRSFLVRAEGERYRIDDAVGNKGDINVLSLSLVFPFGRAPAAAPRQVAAAPTMAPREAPPAPPPPPPPAAPPVVVQAPPPEPLAVAAVPVERRRVSFSAASLFAFDQSVIKPEGKAALDTFARDTRGTSFEVINVEGHTDRLGSTEYNQRLSKQRAEAVRGYLVDVGGFSPAKVSAVGKGETQPVTATGNCKGSKPSPALIACLQPDRRVDVVVSGTR